MSGYFCSAYIRRSNISVLVGSGHYIKTRPIARALKWPHQLKVKDLRNAPAPDVSISMSTGVLLSEEPLPIRLKQNFNLKSENRTLRVEKLKGGREENARLCVRFGTEGLFIG